MLAVAIALVVLGCRSADTTPDAATVDVPTATADATSEGRALAAPAADAPAAAPDDAGRTTLDPTEDVGTFRVVRVVDGDTLVLRGTRGRHVGEEVRLRLAIVDTPEVGECGFEEAGVFVEAWLRDRAEELDLRRPIDAPQTDRFDRILGEVLGPSDGEGLRDSLNVALVSAALARIDDRFGSEDPDLLRRLQAARDAAPIPRCEDLIPR
ncbi:hypothetical protein BH23ACT9_BH23ACT9_02350 [soil metagenome]